MNNEIIIDKKLTKKKVLYEVGDYTIENGVVWIIVDIQTDKEGKITYFFVRGD